MASPDCYNKVPQRGWLMNSRRFLLTGLEAGQFKIKPAGLGSVRACFLTDDLFTLTSCGKGLSLWGSLLRVLGLIMKGDLQDPPEGPAS